MPLVTTRKPVVVPSDVCSPQLRLYTSLAISGVTDSVTDSMLGRAVAGSLGGGELPHKGPWQRVHRGIDFLEGAMIAWMTAWEKRYAWMRL